MAFPFPRPILAASLILASAAVTGLVLLASASGRAASSAPTDGGRQPVLVELFTSEGCSSCPPADALLARLDATQFVPGARAIVLSEHVTYWNYLGWRDPFSLQANDSRQQRYSEHFGLDGVYTPQAVIDGSAQVVASDAGAMAKAVAQAAATKKAGIAIENVRLSGDEVAFAVRSTDERRGRLTVALAEDATRSEVGRGENAGRTLRHVSVVRVMKEMSAEAADGRLLTLKLDPAAGSQQRNTPLRIVAFVTEVNSGRVLGAAEETLSR